MSVLPKYAHSLDLPAAYEAARRIGDMLAAGEVDGAYAEMMTVRWVALSTKSTGVDPSGARSRFIWAVQDAADAAARRWRDAERRIKQVLAPLIASHAPKNRILAEAFNVNEDFGSPLSEIEVHEVAASEVYWSLHRRPNHGGR